ncbi:TPA: hypothetical protein ACGOYJ_001407 [Streptococcus suis]|nr:hypothetical protein [Streptococcus suis]HEM3610920.1 hypothetical protein [Streptococcus suis]HEM3619722.1 hypothetical protein [Streptococcus suis]HEM3621219.1 hypothetical protein [Streptococcus suis]HEM3673776.1 hypothetical protein [Streptococcus suis]
MDRIVLTILALITGGVVLSLLLSRFFRKMWVWYIPSIIGVLFIAYYTFKIQSENMEGFVELGYFLIKLMIVAVMTGNIITNLLICRRRRKAETKR